MALPTLQECKDALRLETTAEDDFLTALLADVPGLVAAYLNRPITGVARTYTDDAETLRAYGRVTRLHVPVYPIATDDEAAPVVTDADDVTVDATTYRVDGDAGSFTAKPDTTFDNGPYRLTVKVGLDQGTEYATQVEPVLRRAILDTVALYYRQRVASVTQSTTAGAQESHTVDPETGLPPRVMGALRHLRLVRVA